uniref:Uncharacterized protein n=1 Tax=Tanacetum cinerariifolium TaxID=118510 RepID=A0A6L2J8Z9_TANCI|nr:hypothetical protein [Tanacetum cinerariifolium]
MALYHALMELILKDEDTMDKGIADKLKKRKSDDADRDEDPPVGPDQGLKRRKMSKDVEPSKKNLGEDIGRINEPPIVKDDPKDRFKKPKRPPTPDPEWNTCKTVDDGPTQNCLSDLAKAEKPSKTFNDLMSTSIYFTAFAMNRIQISDLTKAYLVGLVYNLLKGTCKSYVKLEYNMKECYKALNDHLNWNNAGGDGYPFNLIKPLPLVESRNCLIVLTDYFFNNNLAYLQGGSTDIIYMTSLTKTKAAKYNLQGIEDMVPMLWIPVKVTYDRHALLVTKVKVNKWYGYGHLEENKVRRSDQKLYKFMEGDFPRLHLNDIEDMPLLVVQSKLFNLNGEVIVYLAVALRMFTRRIAIHNKVEDLQLSVERYLKKLNISRPLTHKAERNRLMCTHKLYKFSDGTLISVRDKLKDMAYNLELRYSNVLPRRRWSNLDKKWSYIMVKDIDRQLLERSLEKFVGEREYGEDLDYFSGQYDFVIFCPTLSGQTSVILKYSQLRWKSFQSQLQTSSAVISMVAAAGPRQVRLGSRKSAMDNSFTLGSIEEADNVKILQSCNLAMVFFCVVSFGGSVGSDNQMLVLIDIPDMLHPEGRLFESRGCLLFVCRDDIGSREFTIYEMMKGCSVWTIRYLVNTDELLTPLLERWLIWSTVWSIGLGEREDDSFFGDKLIWKGCKIQPNVKDYQSDL